MFDWYKITFYWFLNQINLEYSNELKTNIDFNCMLIHDTLGIVQNIHVNIIF